jgi:hypothetical protein
MLWLQLGGKLGATTFCDTPGFIAIKAPGAANQHFEESSIDNREF